MNLVLIAVRNFDYLDARGARHYFVGPVLSTAAVLDENGVETSPAVWQDAPAITDAEEIATIQANPILSQFVVSKLA